MKKKSAVASSDDGGEASQRLRAIEAELGKIERALERHPLRNTIILDPEIHDYINALHWEAAALLHQGNPEMMAIMEAGFLKGSGDPEPLRPLVEYAESGAPLSPATQSLIGQYWRDARGPRGRGRPEGTMSWTLQSVDAHAALAADLVIGMRKIGLKNHAPIDGKLGSIHLKAARVAYLLSGSANDERHIERITEKLRKGGGADHTARTCSMLRQIRRSLRKARRVMFPE